MSLTPRQIQLVQESFAKVKPIAAQAAGIFYGKLFEFDPALRKLFKGDMDAQGKKLMTVLAVAVDSLKRLDQLVPVLEQLAERHVQYGVEIADYTTVGNALLQTLKAGLGDDFTPETRQAWIAVYQLVADTMRSHAYQEFSRKSASG